MFQNKSHIIIALFFISMFLTAPVIYSPALTATNTVTSSHVPLPGTGSYSEDFTTTTYLDAGPTNADGWGNGTITNPRTYTGQQLDFYSTSGPVRTLDVQGRKAYIGVYQVGTTQDLQILNLTDPFNIELLGDRSAPDRAFDLSIEGDTLYVGCNYDGDSDGDLFTYNVSNPYTIPGPMDFVYDIPGDPIGLDVQGHFLYVAAKAPNGRFLIYDVEDPNNIRQVYTWAYAHIMDFHVIGQLAYVAHSVYGLKVCNVSNPYNAFIQGSVNTPGNATSVLVDGTIAYIADGPSGVQIADVSNPNSPSIIGSYDTAGNARNLALQGNTLFVADGANGLVILDVADPTHPSFVDHVTPMPYTWDVDLYGGDVVVATDTGVLTLRIGDNLADLPLIGTYDTYEVWDVRVQGEIAYVAAGSDGLLSLNISDPANPVLLDRDTTGASRFYRKLDVQGHLAFVADYGNAFRVFDISDPTNIRFLDSRGLTYATDVAVAGDVAFIADGTSGVFIYNVSNPYNIPSPITSIGGLGNVTALWVQGYHLYIAGQALTDDISIYNIIDISNPAPVNIAGSGSTDQYDIFVDGDVCYNVVVNPDVSVYYNVTDPYNPSWVGGVLFATIGEPRGVWGFGPYMLVANNSGGIALIEAYLNHMDVIASYNAAKGALQVTVHGDYAYVANRSSLVILRLFRSPGSTYATGPRIAQSIEVDTTDRLIENATLTFNAYIPPGTSITFEMSANSGTNWEVVTPGLEHNFANTGNDLRWRATLNSPLDYRSVHLYGVNIDYEHNDLPTAPVLTDPGASDDDGVFPVSWSVSTDDGTIDHYVLQMSDSATFTTILNTWTPSTTSVDVTVTTSGTYHFRVRAIDDDGEIGPWSNDESIDATVPTPPLPPIPGFPVEAIALGAILALGLGLVSRRRKRQNN